MPLGIALDRVLNRSRNSPLRPSPDPLLSLLPTGVLPSPPQLPPLATATKGFYGLRVPRQTAASFLLDFRGPCQWGLLV
jgi:hypothetical protein